MCVCVCAQFATDVLEPLGTNVPKGLPKYALPASADAGKHLTEEREVEPVAWPRLDILPYGALRVQLLGDSMLVCSWVNGDWDCLNDLYRAHVGELQRELHQAWAVGTRAPFFLP